MMPTEEEVEELLAEVKLKTEQADKITAASPDGAQPSLPLSPRATEIANALLGKPNDPRVPMVRGSYRPSGPGPQTKG
jgi:hypothetical protein